MVDVERGRTVEGWLPRRLGGGRGPGRQGGDGESLMVRLMGRMMGIMMVHDA